MASSTGVELVIVKWHDAWTEGDQPVSLDDALIHHAPTEVETIGWKLYQDERGISLANEHYDSTYRGRTFIPSGMIVSVTPYKLSKPRRPKAGTE
jgi:hypothetical protein